MWTSKSAADGLYLLALLLVGAVALLRWQAFPPHAHLTPDSHRYLKAARYFRAHPEALFLAQGHPTFTRTSPPLFPLSMVAAAQISGQSLQASSLGLNLLAMVLGGLLLLPWRSIRWFWVGFWGSATGFLLLSYLWSEALFLALLALWFFLELRRSAKPQEWKTFTGVLLVALGLFWLRYSAAFLAFFYGIQALRAFVRKQYGSFKNTALLLLAFLGLMLSSFYLRNGSFSTGSHPLGLQLSTEWALQLLQGIAFQGVWFSHPHGWGLVETLWIFAALVGLSGLTARFFQVKNPFRCGKPCGQMHNLVENGLLLALSYGIFLIGANALLPLDRFTNRLMAPVLFGLFLAGMGWLAQGTWGFAKRWFFFFALGSLGLSLLHYAPF